MEKPKDIPQVVWDGLNEAGKRYTTEAVGDNYPVFQGARLVLAILAMALLPLNAFAAVSEAQIPQIVQTIIMAESSNRPHVVGDGGKARGLMQIQRATWERYTTEPWSKAFDRDTNRQVGERIVRDLIRSYGKDATVAKVIFTYNTGKRWPKKFPAWTLKHPNNTYRAVFQQAAR